MYHQPPRAHVYRQPTVIATEVQATVKWYDPVRGFGFVQRDGAPDALLPAAIVAPAGHQSLPEGATVVVDIVEGRKGTQVSVLHSVDLSTAAPARPKRNFQDRGDRGFQDRGFQDRGFQDRGFQDRGDRGHQDRGGFRDRGERGFQDRGFQDRGERGFQDRPRRPAAPVGNEPTSEIVGTVKWFNSTKGFGFVGPEDGSRDVFVHASALERSGLSRLDDGQRVRVTIRQRDKGPEAVSLKVED
ncbi:cold-shock protein [Azospirillum thermophilum]|uniref:Cold-shock protein n=1 Tax=Azospirillum thermophilum TaxID=2202148 RepID=A0A2S2CMN6_9PROT|nr:cold-shock protein [Azospirillum thermophilum]AWK85689.1 cold-shock protein [Azospirillum thermophilum]